MDNFDNFDHSLDPNGLYSHNPHIHTHTSHGEIIGSSFHDGHGNANYSDAHANPTSSVMKIGDVTYHTDHDGSLLHTHFDDSPFHPKDWMGTDGSMHYTPDFLKGDHINNMRTDLLGRIK